MMNYQRHYKVISKIFKIYSIRNILQVMIVLNTTIIVKRFDGNTNTM